MIRIILFCVTSFALGSSLNDWIENKSKLIKNNDFKISFNYTITNKEGRDKKQIYQNIEYYNIKDHEQVLKIDNRYILFHPDYSEVINETSEQKFLDKKDEDLEKMKDKLLSIFIDNDFKIIKLSDSKFLLSLNNYYLNINIIFNNKTEAITELSFTENSYLINTNNLVISVIDSVSIDTSDWDSYEVIDLR
jgi:hypothetical protein